MDSHLVSQLEWNFPGGPIGLALAILIGTTLIFLSYRFALRAIPWHARCILILLRITFLGLILFCLCQPTRVKKENIGGNKKNKVAVVFDESGSMKIKGALGVTRLNRALQYFKDVLSQYQKECEFHFYAFAEEMRPLGKSDEVLKSQKKTLSTAFYRNLTEWNATLHQEKFDTVVCFTDGIDSSGEDSKSAFESLEQNYLHHAFVAMTMPLPSTAFVNIQKVEVHSTAPAGTRAPVSLLVQLSDLPNNQTLKLVVTEAGRMVHEESIPHLGKVSITKALNFDVPVTHAGLHTYEAKIQNEIKTLTSATWAIQGLSHDKIRVLLHVGTVDWTIRQLRNVFDRDDQIELEVRTSANIFEKSSNQLAEIFQTLGEIEPYHVIILLNPNVKEMGNETVSNFRSYLKKGGAVLFVTPNPVAAAELTNSPISELLPVEYETASSIDENIDPQSQEVLNTLDAIKQTNMSVAEYLRSIGATIWQQTAYAHAKEMRKDILPLTPFQLTQEGLQNPILNFAVGSEKKPINEMLPKFQDFAWVQKAKSGARVLAVHPTVKTSNGDPRVLFAIQQFGRGRSAVLATDGLWRWRLSLPSDSSTFNKFWHNLINWLGEAYRQPFWVLNSTIHPADKPVRIGFEIPQGSGMELKQLKFSMISAKETQPLTLTPSKEENRYETTIIPKAGITYRLVAEKPGSDIKTECLISGNTKPVDQEMQVLRPNLQKLSALAATGQGVVVEADQKFDWSTWFPKNGSPMIQEVKSPLWHRPWIFILMLGLILSEFLTRRKYGLI